MVTTGTAAAASSSRTFSSGILSSRPCQRLSGTHRRLPDFSKAMRPPAHLPTHCFAISAASVAAPPGTLPGGVRCPAPAGARHPRQKLSWRFPLAMAALVDALSFSDVGHLA